MSWHTYNEQGDWGELSLDFILTAKTLETLPILKTVLESGTSLLPLTLTPTPPAFSTVPLYATL